MPGVNPRKQCTLCSTAKNLRASGDFSMLHRGGGTSAHGLLTNSCFVPRSVQAFRELCHQFVLCCLCQHQGPLSLAPCCSLASNPIPLSAMLPNINSGLDLDSKLRHGSKYSEAPTCPCLCQGFTCVLARTGIWGTELKLAALLGSPVLPFQLSSHFLRGASWSLAFLF